MHSLPPVGHLLNSTFHNFAIFPGSFTITQELAMSLLDLPSELVIQVLASAPTLSDLRALAATSRRAYSIFKRNKVSLIYQTLANELGPVFDDALGLSHLELFNPRAPGY